MSELQTLVQEALGGRYALVRLVDAGGMGMVYIAQDLKHERQVAVKVMRPELRGLVSAERFHREIRFVARLNHPGILPVHDSDDAGEILFFVMPYVEGGSLRDMIAREEQLSLDRAIDIVAEVGGAVAYAHAHGVIHRDLKPENVLLQGGRPVITDFGLALALDADLPRLSESGVAIGTLAYMSPEQLSASSHIDARTDQYSLGCILYELLAGVPPFTGRNHQSVMARKLAGDFPSLRIVRPTVSPGLEATITKAMATLPADRFESVEQFIRALRTPEPRPRRQLAWGVTALGALAILLVALTQSRTSQLDRNTIVVDRFDNRTGDSTLNAVGAFAADWITQGLQGTRLASVIPIPTALQASRFVAQQTAKNAGVDPLALLASETGAGVVVSGSYDRTGNRIVFHAQLSDASQSRWRFGRPRVHTRAALEPITVRQDSIPDAIAQVRGRIMGLLALSFGEARYSAPELDRAPPTFDAYQKFTEGMDAYVAVDLPRATKAFLEAYQRDSTFVVALLYAALNMTNTQQYAVEDSLLQIVARSSNRLTTYDRLWLEYRQAFLANDGPLALRTVRALAAEAPRSKATYNLAIEAWEGGHLEEARDALESLPPEKGPVRDFLPYWGALANVHHLLGDYDSALEVARKARKAHPGKWWPVGWELGAMAALGQVTEVLERAATMANVPEDDMHWSPAEALRETAEELRAHGHVDASRTVSQIALRWYRSFGTSNRLGPRDRMGWALTLYALGQYDEAGRVARQLQNDQPRDVRVLGLMGTIAARSGQPDTARSILNRLTALPIRYQTGRPAFHASLIAAALGENELALELLRRARSEGRAYGQWVHRELDLETIRKMPAFVALTRPVPLSRAE